jgi:hypothetical protein
LPRHEYAVIDPPKSRHKEGTDMDALERVCAPLDECATYARGVEFGKLLARMQKGRPIAGHFLRHNQDQILQAATRLGWTVLETTPQGDHVWIKMKKRAPQRERRLAVAAAVS